VTSRACRLVQRELPWFVGGDLPASRRDAVQDHLRGCLPCRRQAASLQQSTKALRAMAGDAASAAAGPVDEALFTSMHASILATVEAEVAASACHDRMPLRRLVLPVAAAVALFSIGWWIVRSPSGLSLFERPPIVSPAMAVGPATVVPYAGPRVELRLLGDERSEDPAGSLGPGLMGRWRLRSLVGEGVLPHLPPDPGVAGDARDR
jgi:hypothetical protein